MRAGVVLALTMPGAVVVLSSQTVPVGTALRVRFIDPILSGRTASPGTIRVQSLDPLKAGGCTVVPAFAQLMGTIQTSRAGHTIFGRGSLRIAFDSIRVQAGRWLSLSAVLDSLEWSPGHVKNGTAFSGRRKMAWLVGEQLFLLAADVAAFPATALVAAQTVRSRSRVSILAGEEGVIRLVSPIQVPVGFPCRASPAPIGMMAAPELAGRSSDRSGNVPGDPVNLLFLGGQEALEKAFSAADWVVAYRSTRDHLIRGAAAAILARQDLRAPVSPQYYDGRPPDVAFERASPSARIRHHVRFWRTASLVSGDTVWAGVANEDVGLLVTLHGIPTHRIDPLVDKERELIVREMLAGGCTRLRGYVMLPGTSGGGVNASHQRFLTDQLAAVLHEAPCPDQGDPRTAASRPAAPEWGTLGFPGGFAGR